MKKYIVLAATLAFMAPVAASAASFPNIVFDNGDVTISGQGGTTANATFRVNVAAGEVVEQIQTDVIGDNLAPVCTEVGGNLGLQEGQNDVTLPVKFPPNTGTYTVEVRGYGVFGGMHQPDCLSNQVATASFNGAIRTVAGGSSTGSGTTENATITALRAMIADLMAQIKKLTETPPAPAKPAWCAGLVAAGANVFSLQGFLVQNGFMTAAQVSTGPGVYGPKTTSAHMAAQAACK